MKDLQLIEMNDGLSEQSNELCLRSLVFSLLTRLISPLDVESILEDEIDGSPVLAQPVRNDERSV